MCWIFLINNKSEFTKIFMNFVHYIENQMCLKVKSVRTDNAPELSKGTAHEFYLAHGIKQQISCAETTMQNGVVERKHKHILKTARCLFFQSNLPMKFWRDCVQCAVHLINRMPLAVLNGITPYEKFHGTKPSLEHLKVFGRLCFVNTLKQGRHKFSPRAEECVFFWDIQSTRKAIKCIV